MMVLTSACWSCHDVERAGARRRLGRVDDGRRRSRADLGLRLKPTALALVHLAEARPADLVRLRAVPIGRVRSAAAGAAHSPPPGRSLAKVLAHGGCMLRRRLRGGRSGETEAVKVDRPKLLAHSVSAGETKATVSIRSQRFHSEISAGGLDPMDVARQVVCASQSAVCGGMCGSTNGTNRDRVGMKRGSQARSGLRDPAHTQCQGPGTRPRSSTWRERQPGRTDARGRCSSSRPRAHSPLP
eukprot:1123736-Prymnesium_polylepis.2